MPERSDDQLLEALRERFGHERFRDGQREVVDTVLSGRDVLVVMPTGGGKSLTFQLPAVLDMAPTIVVSPLIALMKDQVDGLVALGLPAAALHSNVDAGTQRRVAAAYAAGELRLLYVAPERLTRGDVRAMLAARRPGRIVVDEAHCISEWGHDFRRDYLRIGEIAAELRLGAIADEPRVQLVACTATATPTVRGDIAARLGMLDPAVIVRGFERPELFLAVERVRDEASKLARLDAVVDPGDGHTIVYAGTRARAASVAERLGPRFPTMLYHAELSPDERVRAQERFAAGEVRVAVATSAFGMGVDIGTVRQVIHVGLPQSLEEYYQQAGRAGRDGRTARCVVIFGPADRRLPEFFIDAAHPDAGVLRGVARSLVRDGRDPGRWRDVEHRDPAVASLSDAAGDAARAILLEAGVVQPDGGIDGLDADRLPVDHGRIARHREAAFDRFGRLLGYLAAGQCRHRVIVEHFGEAGGGGACGDACDVCRPERAGEGSGVELDVVSVRKALSGVARLNGRAGVTRVAAVLAGARSKALEAAPGLRALPTYGALAGWREVDIVELLRRLIDAGAVTQTSPPYPTVALTPRGLAAMRGELDLGVRDPRGRRGAAPAARTGVPEPAELPAGGQELLDRLRGWRAAVARAHTWPAYVVMNDRTLHAIAAAQPRTAGELLQVPGVGPGKLSMYGDDLLALVADAGGAASAS